MSRRPGNWQLFLHNRLAVIGLLLLGVIVSTAVAAPWLPLANPDETQLAQRLIRPLQAETVLGTDHLGRDLLSRLLWGTQVSLAVGLSATLIAALIGSTIGLIAGFWGGKPDHWLMRGIDLLMAFPYILLALAIVAVLGPGLLNALYAIALVNIPFFARNIRGVTLGLRRREFIAAARLSGKTELTILLTEVLPNVFPTIVITMSTTVGWMILETAGLSFLGLGAQPPTADLGSMLGEGRKLLFNAPHVSLIPGLMIFALVMSINLVGDGVRDLLDPRLRSGVLLRPAARTQVDRSKGPSSAVPMSEEEALSVQQLTTDFQLGKDRFQAVRQVSFTLHQQECLGLVGESGSGKSVTALSLLGLTPSPPGIIRDGRVLLDDRDLLEASLEELRQLRGRRVAYVFQDPLSTLHPLHRVGGQLVEALRSHQALSHAEAWNRAVELLNLVRIPNSSERAKAYPHELSGGMRQRVSIAMALANDPEILIVDEPTTALDVTVQAEILALLDELRQERKAALLFITHDFGVVSELCDRVAVMYAGQIVEVGPTQELLQAPQHPYTRKLLASAPKLGEPERRLSPLDGLPPSLNHLPQGCAFAARCDQATPECQLGAIPLREIGRQKQVRCLLETMS